MPGAMLFVTTLGLAGAGIGYAQGFMISRPKPADALADWLRGPARKLAAVA